MMQEVIGTREATKRETRRALVEAALHEFAERGFDAPSLDSICARAGFTRGAFYVHFSSRDELVSAAMERAIGTFVERIMPDDDAALDIGTTIAAFADVVVPGLIRDMQDGLSGPGLAIGTDIVPGPPFHKFLEACVRSEAVREGMAQAMARVVDRLQMAGESAQRQQLMRDDVRAQDVATLLLLTALGVFSATELGLSLDVDALRDTALRLVARS